MKEFMSTVTVALPALKVAERINRIEVSATMAVVAEAEKLRQSGVEVGLGGGMRTLQRFGIW